MILEKGEENVIKSGERLRARNTQLQDEVQGLRKEIDNLTERNKTVLNQKDKVETENEKILAKIEEQKLNKSKLNEKLNKMNAENKNLRELHNESNPICAEKKVHKDDKKMQMQKTIDKLSDENSKLLQEQHKNKLEISKLRQEQNEKAVKLSQYNKDDKIMKMQNTTFKLLQEQNKTKKEISKLRQDQKKKTVKVSQERRKCCTTKCWCALFILYFIVLPFIAFLSGFSIDIIRGEFSGSN